MVSSGFIISLELSMSSLLFFKVFDELLIEDATVADKIKEFRQDKKLEYPYQILANLLSR